MERRCEKNSTLNKPPKGSYLTQQYHKEVDFGFSKLRERVPNLEHKVIRKWDIMDIITKK